MKKNTAKKNKKGFGLVELALALAIAAIIGLVIFRAYTEARDNQRIEETIGHIKMVNSTVEGIYASRANYNDLRDLSLASHMPKSMIDEQTGEIKNVYSGRFEVDEVSLNSTSDAYRVTIYNIPEKACQRLATSDFGRHAKHVHVSGLAIVDDPAQLSIMQAKWNCNDATYGNTVSWIFQ